MRPADYRDALRLLNTSLAAVEQRQAATPIALHRRLLRLALQLDLLRARLRQPAVHLQRN